MDNTNWGNKSAGLALMAGVILSMFASFLYPGGLLLSPVDHNNFPEAIGVLADYPSLTHIVTLTMMLALFLEAYGFFALTGIPSQAGSLSAYSLRFGIAAMLFAYGALTLELGARHMVVHIVTHGVTGDSAAAASMALPDLALAVYSVGAGLHITFIGVSSLAALMLGLGLAAHFTTVNIYRVSAYVIALVGVVGLINLLVTQHFHDAGLAFLAIISSLALTIGAVFLFIIGVGLYKGIKEFGPAATAEPVGV